MKKLSIEEKAKRYDEAIEKAKQLSKELTVDDIVEPIFPDLKESEDGKIRKEIRDFICWATDRGSITKEQLEKSNLWIAWLEKKGGQKSANWFQELEDKLANATPQQLAKWKEKYFKEEPAEWSEEDEKMLSDIIKDLVHPWNEYIPDRIEEEIKWLKNRLKSLRHQSHWKPNKEQLHILESVIADYDNQGLSFTKDMLCDLYEQLKKLKD